MPDESSIGTKAPAILKKKIGPLPIGVWAVVIGGGLVVLVIARRRRATATGGTESNAPVDSGAQGAPGGPAFGVGPYAGGIPGVTVSSAGQATHQDATNFDWVQRVSQLMIGLGFDPAMTVNALTKFISGTGDVAISTQEQGIIEVALQKAGPPPAAPNPNPSINPLPRVSVPIDLGVYVDENGLTHHRVLYPDGTMDEDIFDSAMRLVSGDQQAPPQYRGVDFSYAPR